MKQEPYFRPLIPLLLSLIPGIFLGLEHPGHLLLAAFGLLFAGIALARTCLLKKEARFSPIALFVAVGYLSIQPWAAPRFSPNHVVRFIGPDLWRLSGTVEEVLHQSQRHAGFVLSDLRMGSAREDSTPVFRAAGKIRVSVWRKAPDLKPGDAMRMTARFQPVRNFNNPGGFNYQRYLALKGIWTTAHASEKDLEVESRKASLSLQGRIRSSREALSRFIEEEISGKIRPEAKGVLKALILGDREGIPPGLREAFNRSGVSHILAISGLHIGIVAAGAFWLSSRLLSCFSIFLRHAWTRKGAALFSLLPVLVYGALSGMSPSTQRAVIMVGVFLLAFFFEKEHEPFNTLAVAALGILIYDPPALFSISFQLSFASVFWILFGMSRTRRLWGRSSDTATEALFVRMKKRLLSFFLVSAFAILGTLPIVMVYFNQVSLVSLAANMVIIPLMGFIAVPAGLMAVFLFPVHLQAAAYLMQTSAAVIAHAIFWVDLFSSLPFASLKTVTPNPLEIVLIYGAAWACFEWKKRPDRTPEAFLGAPEDKSLPSGFNRFKCGLLKACRARNLLWAVLAIGCMDIGYWLHYRLWHEDLRISVMDVGAGNAVLAELPKGYNLLIDGGGFPDNETFDVGANVVAPFLWRNKILSIDAVVLSHPNADHLNGLLFIARNFHVKELWTNDDRGESHAYRALLEIVYQKGIRMPSFQSLERSFRIHGVGVEIFYPPSDYRALAERERWRNDNNNSLVIRLQYGNETFLFPGDIMEKAERELVATAGEAIRSTLMVAPHHGGKTSSSPGFLEAVKPQVVVVSVGKRGPHPQVVKRYRDLGARVYSTHRHGAIRIVAGDGPLKIRETVFGPFGQEKAETED